MTTTRKNSGKACDRYLELLRDDDQHPNHYPNQNGQDVNKLIVTFCKEPGSVQEIMDKFAFHSRERLHRKNGKRLSDTRLRKRKNPMC